MTDLIWVLSLTLKAQTLTRSLPIERVNAPRRGAFSSFSLERVPRHFYGHKFETQSNIPPLTRRTVLAISAVLAT